MSGSSSSSITTVVTIDPQHTRWIFVADSDEPRHLYDIVFGVHVLRAKRVAAANIYVCTDHIAAANHLHPYGIRDIRSIAALDDLLAGLSCETAVLVIGGHGAIAGIGRTQVVLSPSALIAKVRAIQGLQGAVLVLTQCFAGVFNLLDAVSSPPLVLIGATNLNNSISAALSLSSPLPQSDGTSGLQTWSANLFSWSFFTWIERQPDLDGDGAATIMDAYKFAGAVSNQHLLTLKSRLYVEALKLTDQLKTLEQQVSQARVPREQTPQSLVQSMSLQITLEATQERLQETLKVLYLHQEPWILHASLARRMVVTL